MNRPVIVLGAGGHAMVVVDILQQLKVKILAIVSKDKPKKCSVFEDLPFLGNDSAVFDFSPNDVYLVNGIGSLPGSKVRADIFRFYKNANYEFMSVISPNSIISTYAKVEEGVHIFANTVINAGATIGANTIINTGCVVEHECKIGKNNHIAPGACLSGSVITNEYVHIGVGANIIQGVEVGKNSVVASGASLTEDLDENKTLYVAKPFTNARNAK